MSYDRLGSGALDYAPCRYGASPLVFRGPQRRLDAPFVAFLGGNETYGKFLKAPFPALVESDLGLNCVNFGIQNAGVDVFVNSKELLEAVQNATATVVQIVGANNLSNRYYSVHPRRNDRFVAASELLKSTFPEVDFAEFHYTKHMLGVLHATSKERFSAVRAEVQKAWSARMRLLLKKLPGNVVLVWFADHAPLKSEPVGLNPARSRGPLFVTQEMLEDLRSDVADIVQVTASAEALSSGTKGMVFNEIEQVAACEMLGPPAHGEVAARLSRVLHGLI